MRNSDGSTVAAGHIETLLEDMEVAQSTRIEEALTQVFGLLNIGHSSRLELAAVLRSQNKPEDQVRKDSGISIDFACFAAWEVRLKANDLKGDLSNAPSCSEKPAQQIFWEKSAPARAKNMACLKTAGANHDAIESCMTEYLSELKSINCSGRDEYGQFTCQPSLATSVGESASQLSPVSESFEKAALHAVIALRDANGTALENEHLKTLLEDVEMEQRTPEEKAITDNLKLWLFDYDSSRDVFLSAMQIEQGTDHTPQQQIAAAKKASQMDMGYPCFDAYETSLKAHSSTIPPECLAVLGRAERKASAEANMTTCVKTAGSDPTAAIKCAKKYQLELNSSTKP